MPDNKINSASYSFIGLFQHEKAYVRKSLVQRDYKALDLYEKSKKYFDQKYYSNWIRSFLNNHKDKNISTHCQLNETSSLFEKTLQLPIDDLEDVIDFNIKGIEVFFFSANLGVFVIKIDLPETHHNWIDIGKFGLGFRNSTINKKHHKEPISVEIIEQFITSKFHHNPKNWRQYNPQLKSAIFVDIAEELDSISMDKLLYQLGTFSVPNQNQGFNEPDEKYFKQLIDQGGISLFKNWRALCLYDSISRIAINLNQKDQYRLWENEYILIYIYVLYARYFLHYTNNQLTEEFESSKLVKNQRDNFYKFQNEFNHTKISYKFLPNVIYTKLKHILDIEEEVSLIDEKLTRINILKQELYQKRINRILFMLTLLTLISVAYDGGQMLKSWEWTQSLIISVFIIFISIALIGLLYSKRK